MRRTILILALAWVLGVAATPVFAKRVALVIGNNIYRNLPSKDQLKNAVNDARAVKAGGYGDSALDCALRLRHD